MKVIPALTIRRKALRSPAGAALLIAVITTALAASPAAAVTKQVVLAWNYDSAAAPNLAGFQAYQNDRPLCRTANPGARQLSCAAEITSESNKFTITAFDKYGNESAPSLPWHFFYQDPKVAVGDIGIEAGQVEIDDQWHTISFGRQFSDPVIVAPALSQNDPQPALVRIRNVTGSGFEIRIQGWDYLDGRHDTEETVGYLVMERGVYILPGGIQVEAGRFNTTATGTNTIYTIPFINPGFTTAPVVMPSVVSENDAGAVIARPVNIYSTSFKFFLQVEKANPKYHLPETISYIAWQPSEGYAGSLWYEVDKTAAVVTHQPSYIPFDGDTNVIPIFLGGMQTASGRDPAVLRWFSMTGFGVNVRIAEEQSLNTQTDHNPESVGYMLFR